MGTSAHIDRFVLDHLPPADQQPDRLLAQRHHLRHAVVRPVAGPGVNLERRTGNATLLQPQHRAHGIRIAGATRKPDTQAGLRRRVAVHLRLRPVLRHDEILTTIAVKIRRRRPALLAVDHQPALLAAHRLKPAIVLDVPLLFEKGGWRRCHFSVVVSAPFRVQRARVLARPGMTREKFAGILKGQMPDREKRRRADVVIETGRGRRETWTAVKRLVSSL